MALLKTDELISIEDYLAAELKSDIKHEYLGGVVHAMAGGKARHNKVSANSIISLGASLKGKVCQPYTSDMKVKIHLPRETRFYYPDLQVICEPVNDELTYTDKPVVVVEVLSESTRRVDLGEKREAYLSIPSLKVLIIVDPTKVYVRVDRAKVNGGFEQELYLDVEDTIDLPEIETSLPIADIYEGIDLEVK